MAYLCILCMDHLQPRPHYNRQSLPRSLAALPPYSPLLAFVSPPQLLLASLPLLSSTPPPVLFEAFLLLVTFPFPRALFSTFPCVSFHFQSIPVQVSTVPSLPLLFTSPSPLAVTSLQPPSFQSRPSGHLQLFIAFPPPIS